MKKLITIVLILISTLTNAQNDDIFASNYQINQINQTKINLNLPTNSFSNKINSNIDLGLGMLVSGAAFLVGGLLTMPDYDGLYGDDKPFIKQGPRMWVIVGGGIVFTTGFVIVI